MQTTIDLDDEAATALTTIIRRLTADDYADALTACGVDVKAQYRELDALSLQLSIRDASSTRRLTWRTWKPRGHWPASILARRTRLSGTATPGTR